MMNQTFRMNDRVVAKVRRSERLSRPRVFATVVSSIFETEMGLIDVIFDDDRDTKTVSTVVAANFEKVESR